MVSAQQRRGNAKKARMLRNISKLPGGTRDIKLSYLLGSTLAASVPVAIAVNVGNCSSFLHRIKGKEMNLVDSCSCL